MAVWGTIGSGLGKIGQGLTKGAKKVGEVAKTGRDKLVDILSSDTILQSPTEPQPTPTPTPAPTPTPDDTTKTPEETEAEARRKAFIKALSSSGQQLAKQQNSNNYEFIPSRVDYSQYMGLSPMTQRYLYGGM